MFERPTTDDLRRVAAQLGMHPSDAYLESVLRITTPLAGAYAALDSIPDELPPVKYPRDGGYRPSDAENPHGAWYIKTAIKGAAGGKLAGRRVAVKDNVCVAGVPMMIGAKLLEGCVPEADATIVTRILDAGGEIAGKAVCEYYCISGGSHTSETGPVHNPRKRGYSAGGSSSGSAALVAAGDVDLAIGGDQAGSIRIPSGYCGIVGMKPTFGLVPYTGIAGLEFTLDSTGPMTRTVADNALLLEVLAGPDGIDSRQRDVKVTPYAEGLDRGVKGLRIGVVAEGFGHANGEPGVETKVRAAARRFADLGATVADVSIPMHRLGVPIWVGIRSDSCTMTFLETNGAGSGFEGLYVPALAEAGGRWRGRTDEFADTVKIACMFGKYALDRYGGHYYGKAQNLRRRLRAAYDAALAQYDLLLMPTTVMKAQRIPGPDASPEEITQRSWEPVTNTAPFNVTGHPAISIPCGLEDERPIGVMLVGRHWDEATIYRASAAFERSGDWTTF
jgi:amidase